MSVRGQLMIGALLAGTILLAIHYARVHAGSAETHGSINIDGRARTYEVHVPAGYDGREAVPLVLALHGRLGNGKGQARLSRLDSVSDVHGFLVVYPDGLDRSWADGRGATPSDKNNVNDVQFLSALIDKLSGEYRIDATRVYATGMSNGGFMIGKVACDLSAKIAGVAIVAASISDTLASSCAPQKPVSILIMQGMEDPLVPFVGGPLGKNGDRGTVLSHADAVKKWVALNHCTGEPTVATIPDKVGDGTSINTRIYSNCDAGSEVADYAVVAGGHAWPGGVPYSGEFLIGKTSKNLDASTVIWEFFSRHSR